MSVALCSVFLISEANQSDEDKVEHSKSCKLVGTRHLVEESEENF